MATVKFYRREEYLCGDGCCTMYGDDELVATREVTDEQLQKLEELDARWTEEAGIEGEDERFDYFIRVDV
jgi:hypothetical protein